MGSSLYPLKNLIFFTIKGFVNWLGYPTGYALFQQSWASIGLPATCELPPGCTQGVRSGTIYPKFYQNRSYIPSMSRDLFRTFVQLIPVDCHILQRYQSSSRGNRPKADREDEGQEVVWRWRCAGGED